MNMVGSNLRLVVVLTAVVWTTKLTADCLVTPSFSGTVRLARATDVTVTASHDGSHQHRLITAGNSKGIGTFLSKSALLSTKEANANANADTSKEETLSESDLDDVDARVLRIMLQEKKLDLETEEDVRKLLERGTVKTVPKRTQTAEKKVPEESEFSSKILQTLADTKLWKKVSAQAADAVASVGIWVSNKVEQDVKVLAALGVFAWDRAVRDVARALPAANAQAKKILILTNSSSFIASPPPTPEGLRNVMEDMKRPVDEIKSVSREILGILSGERTAVTASAANSRRGLRTAAPAGVANSAERQRRAYEQRRKLDKQQKDVTKIGGSVVDTVWELRRELKAETNAPGYKTVPIRNAIEAGVAVTGNVLRGVREEARLAAAKRKELRLREAREETTDDHDNIAPGETDFYRRAEYIDTPASTDFKPLDVTGAFDARVVERTEQTRTDPEQEKILLAELKTERARIFDRLTKCIDDPAVSWLTPTVIDRLENLDFFSGPGMQDSLTKMILLRDEMENRANDETVTSLERSVDELLDIRAAIDYLCTITALEVSDVIATQMRTELLEHGQSGEEIPLILRLEEAVASVLTAKATIKEPEIEMEARIVTPEIFDVIPDAVFVDVIPDAFVMDTQSGYYVDEGIDAAGAGLMAEIVTDDDFDNAVGAAKAAFDGSGVYEESEKKENNILMQATLRSLDVVLFIVERALTVGVPSTVMALKTAMTRVEEVNRNGKGSVGWKQLGNLADTKGRY